MTYRLSPAEILALYQNPVGAIPEPTAAALQMSLGGRGWPFGG